jgi:hypothetical protein
MDVYDEILEDDAKPKPLLTGTHLQELGMKPGPEFRLILDSAYEAQLRNEFDDIDGAINWLKSKGGLE